MTAATKVRPETTATATMNRRGTLEVQKARRAVRQSHPLRTMMAHDPLQLMVKRT